MYHNTSHRKLWFDPYQKSRIITRGFRLKKDKDSFKSLIKKQVQEYCTMSTIHGLSYTANSEYSTVERTFWAIGTFISLGIGVLLSYLMLYRFSISPTIATLETYTYPTWKIPFPAVSLCNVNKVRKSYVRSIIGELKIKYISESDIEEYFKKITALITRDNIQFSHEDMVIQQYVMRHINGSIDDIMRLVSQPCSELLVECRWQGKRFDCDKIFQSSKSVEGYCCSFNYRPNNVNTTFNAEYIGGTGRKDGLTVIMDANLDDYYSTTDPYFGVKAIIHASNVFPETSILTEIVQPGDVVSLSIDPYYVESVETVKNLKLSQRNCLFPNELSLNSTDLYDYQQCITECRVDTILAICNCIPFIYPFINNSSIICDLKNAKCLNNNAATFSYLLPNKIDENSQMICPKCLPECSDVIYTLSSSVSKLFYNNFSINPPLKKNESQLHVYYEDISCIKYRREAMVTWDSLIASLGGIFGLCLGGSVLSIVELVYHFTYKFVKTIKNSENNQRKIAPIKFIR